MIAATNIVARGRCSPATSRPPGTAPGAGARLRRRRTLVGALLVVPAAAPDRSAASRRRVLVRFLVRLLIAAGVADRRWRLGGPARAAAGLAAPATSWSQALVRCWSSPALVDVVVFLRPGPGRCGSPR